MRKNYFPEYLPDNWIRETFYFTNDTKGRNDERKEALHVDGQ